MADVRPAYIPLPYQDAADAGGVILRDGSTATIRVALATDRPELEAFFGRLSPESRQRRFFSASPPTASAVASLCDCSNPRSCLTLIVVRQVDGVSRIIATGSYLAVNDQTAEAAFAVDDSVQGQGLGTILLERLALLAVRHGLTRFWAVTHADNQPMINMFRESGFAIHEKLERSTVEVDFSVVPSATSVARTEFRDRVATAASLRPFFQPKAVAVVGASRDPGSIGYRILEAIVTNRFQGPVYPVNPRATVVGCIRAYPSVRDLPEPADLAVIAVPRDRVLSVVDECAARGVRALVVISAGFAEVDADGRALQKQLLDKVRGYGMRMIGPNCLGILNADPAVSLNASFSPVFPPSGKVAMSSQSGALGLAILAAARHLQLGLSTFVSVGNKADVSSNDLLQYWEEDPGTGVILLYLESFGNPRRFARIARRISRVKPIVAVKGGRTQAGKRAAGSHTAALAASDVAVDALFRQTGVIRADTLEEMLDLAALLSCQPLPAGRRVGVITNAGGPGILCADMCEAGGLVLPEFSEKTRASLARVLPSAASSANPIDMIASATPEQFRKTVETVLASGEVDALIVIFITVGLSGTDAVASAIAEGVAAARVTRAKQPVLTCLMPEQRTPAAPPEAERFPSYIFPESAARVLSKVAAYADWRAQPPGVILEFADADAKSAHKICGDALALRGPGWLSSEETRNVLSTMGLPVASGGVARTADEAVALAKSVGFPVAVKLDSRRLVHKTEIGGVCLNLADESAVRHAFDSIRTRLAALNQLDAMEGVLVQRMLAQGVEVMVGMTQDPLFGPLIAFGLGGIHVEILGDVCFRVTPLTDRDAADMVRSIRGYRLLQGYRGHPPADIDALQELLLRLSRLVEEVPEIHELDLNPVFALAPGQGCRIVDARIALA